MTYQQAEQEFEFNRKGNSVLLEENVRLVKLSADRYGIQLVNTYVVRICANGCYVLNTSGHNDQRTMDVINKYSPARLKLVNGAWHFPNNERYFDNAVINQAGDLLSYDSVV